jgi:hypothetical protein
MKLLRGLAFALAVVPVPEAGRVAELEIDVKGAPA